MSVREFQRWIAFDRISPIGDERIDLLFGILVSTMVNLQPRKDGKTYRPVDFMPYATKPDASVALSKQIRQAFSSVKKA